MAVPTIKKAIGNGSSTTLSSSMSDSATSAPLTSDTNFSAVSGEGQVIIGEETDTPEFSYATGKTGASLDIPLANRGLEGGSAVAHASGDTVKGVITAGMWNDFTGAFLEEHADDGSHSFSGVVPVAGTASTSAEIRLAEDTDNGTNYIGLKAPLSVGTSKTFVLPDADGSANQVLKTDGSATLKWGSVDSKSVSIQVVAGGSSLSVGDGKAYFTVPEELNGMNLIAVHARVITAGTTNTTDIQIHNVTDAQDMLSTKLTIDSTETGSDTGTAAVVDATKDDVVTNDLLRIDIDAVSTTAPKGLIVRLRFALP